MNRYTLGMLSLLMNPEGGEGTNSSAPAEANPNTPATNQEEKKPQVGDNVEWINADEDEMFGKIQSIDSGIAQVQDDEGKLHKVPVDDLEVAGEFKVIAELPVNNEDPNSEKIAFTLKKYKKGRKGNEAFLQGYGFAVPRFPNINTLVTHLNNLLVKQNRHKSQNAETGLTADDIILDNFQSMLDSKLRTKVKNEATAELLKLSGASTVTNPGIIAWEAKRNGDKTLFNAEQSYNYLPGIREASGLSKAKIIAAKIKELMAGGMTPDKPELQALLLELATSVGV